MILDMANSNHGRKNLDIPIRTDETLDGLGDGELKIIQKTKGYRFSIDTVLLANFCRLKETDYVIDLGTGNAVIPVMLAARNPSNRIVGVEIQEDFIDMARRNIKLNELDGRITVMHLDVKELRSCLDKGSFDIAICNPPYHPLRTGRLNPIPQKALARHEILGSLRDMAQIASFLLRSMGRFYVIHPASRIVDMLFTLRTSNLEPKCIQMIHSNASEDARLVRVEAVKGGRKELRVLKPLFVYDLEGNPTKEIQGIYAIPQTQYGPKIL
jgi:tRNA1Val (adenine37-N6)-methyltransferase